MKIQLETLENESAETGTEDSSVSSKAINDMLEHAKSQNELYRQEFQETEEDYVPVPPEVGDKMKHYKLNQLFADEASSMEIPQFMIETGRSLFLNMCNSLYPRKIYMQDFLYWIKIQL